MNAIQISNVSIKQNADLFSLTDLHKASGGEAKHEPNRWLRSQQAQELIAEIQAEGKIAVKTVRGGNKPGTFVCKELVYAYATWISAKFFLLVIRTFDAAVSGSLKTQTAKPGCLTLEQQDEIKKFHRELVQSAPKEKQAALAIGLWSAVKTKFGVSYKDVPEAHYPEVLSLMARVALEKGALSGVVLDKETHRLRNLSVLLHHTEYVCQWLMHYEPAIRLFNNTLAGNLIGRAVSAYQCCYDVARQTGFNLQSHEYWRGYPFDGDCETMWRYRELYAV